jgi:hypothetical protein
VKLFDASAWVGAWPFGAGRHETLSALIDALLAQGIDGAAVSPVRAVLAPEPMSWNLALLDDVRREARTGFALSWVPVINPTLTGWERDLDACLDAGGDLPGAVRLIPNYHGYAPDAPVAIECVRRVAAVGRPVIVQLRMQDERAHHPLMLVPGVDPGAVVRLAQAVPEARIIAGAPYMAELATLAPAPNVAVELSMAENGDTLPSALAALGPDRLLFGTHAPLHYPAPSVAKLRGADDVLAVVAGGTARAAMGVTTS